MNLSFFYRFLNILVLFVLFFITSPFAFADIWTIPVNGVCCTNNHELYIGKRANMSEGYCSVDVDLGDLEIYEGIDIKDASSRSYSFQGKASAYNFSVPRVQQGSAIYVGWRTHRSRYHAYLNDAYATALQTIMSAQTDDKYKERLAADKSCSGFTASLDPSKSSGVNYTPSCMAERLLCSFELYQGVLDTSSLSDDVSHYFTPAFDLVPEGQVDPEGGNATSFDKLTDIASVYSEVAKEKRALLEEALYTRMAFEQTLDLYHQFLKGFRLHLQYKGIIQAFVKSRTWTDYFSQMLGCLPGKLVGTATTECN
jgi:hypothetical protein